MFVPCKMPGDIELEKEDARMMEEHDKALKATTAQQIRSSKQNAKQGARKVEKDKLIKQIVDVMIKGSSAFAHTDFSQLRRQAEYEGGQPTTVEQAPRGIQDATQPLANKLR